MKIIAVANQKGGVGKTTTCVNLTAALKSSGRRVLLCDMDPQANATSGMGVDKSSASPGIYEVLIGGIPAKSAVVKTKYGDVLPSGTLLTGAGIELVSLPEREYVLKKALLTLAEDYDYALIDCPPSLEMLTLNALCAAQTILVPVQCEYFALEGLTDLLMSIKMTKKALNPELDIEGVLLTMFDSRTNFSAQVAAEVKRYFKDKVYNVVIPRNVRIAEAPSHGLPVTAYDRSSRGSAAYLEFAKELMERSERKRR